MDISSIVSSQGDEWFDIVIYGEGFDFGDLSTVDGKLTSDVYYLWNNEYEHAEDVVYISI